MRTEKKVSLYECKKILNTKGVYYTDEEILEIRDWMYHIIEIILEAEERHEGKNVNQNELRQAA